jgi:hypothetical protein
MGAGAYLFFIMELTYFFLISGGARGGSVIRIEFTWQFIAE